MATLLQLEDHPISQVQWADVNMLRANDWNPNRVLAAEYKLLKLSLMLQGWIQPLLVGRDLGGNPDVLEIIDGFHRYTLVKTDPEVNLFTHGMAPVVVLELTKPQRMMLTIRINRAKGNHLAFKMHEAVAALHTEHLVSLQDIGTGIGATQHEVELLLQADVFEKKDVASTPYSKAWVPLKGRTGARVK